MSVGLIIAIITNRLHTLMNNPFSEISLTITTVFGSALVANAMGLSGLIAVVIAGLYFGNVAMKKESDMSKEVRDVISNFWEIFAFFVNSSFSLPWSNNEHYRCWSKYHINHFSICNSVNRKGIIHISDSYLS
jgi:NhaP-type Na+/H+ or K+/H+ antiporter